MTTASVIRAACELKKLEAPKPKMTCASSRAFRGLGHGDCRDFVCMNRAFSENHPALKKSAEWLIEKGNPFLAAIGFIKIRRKSSRAAGFLKFNNKWNPDVDDTGDVLARVAKNSTDDPQKRDRMVQPRPRDILRR